MPRILIAEDEERIARFVEKGLRAAGYSTQVVSDGVSAVEHASAGGYDLLVLDVGLPRMDGFTVLKVLRSMEHHLPIILCTARDGVDDVVSGLEGGADDYLSKPFRFEELLARVRIRLRAQPGTAVSTVLVVGDVSLDITTRVVTVGEKQLELSAREFAMLREFLEHPGQVLSRTQLISRVWGYEFDGYSNVVDVYVGYLRGKIGAARIATVRGVGYRLVD